MILFPFSLCTIFVFSFASLRFFVRSPFVRLVVRARAMHLPLCLYVPMLRTRTPIYVYIYRRDCFKFKSIGRSLLLRAVCIARTTTTKKETKTRLISYLSAEAIVLYGIVWCASNAFIRNEIICVMATFSGAAFVSFFFLLSILLANTTHIHSHRQTKHNFKTVCLRCANKINQFWFGSEIRIDIIVAFDRNNGQYQMG